MIILDDVLEYMDEPNSGKVSPAIRKAVRDEIIDRGYGHATSSSIAARAGISRVTLYRHTGSMKRLLLESLTGEFRQIVVDALKEVMGEFPASGTGREFVVEVAITIIENLLEDELMLSMLHQDPNLLVPYLTVRFGGSQQILLEALTLVVRECSADHTIDTTDPKLTASMIIALSTSFVISHSILENTVGTETSMRELRKALTRYLTPDA